MTPPGMDCPSAEARPWPRRVADLCDARGCLGSRSGLHNKPTAWMAWFGKPYRAYQPWTRPVPDVLDLAAPNGRLQPALTMNWFDAVRLTEIPIEEPLPGSAIPWQNICNVYSPLSPLPSHLPKTQPHKPPPHPQNPIPPEAAPTRAPNPTVTHPTPPGGPPCVSPSPRFHHKLHSCNRVTPPPPLT